MDWQIDRKWSCAAVGCAEVRWVPLGCGMFGNEKSSAKHMVLAHGAVQNRIRPCKCKFQCKRKCKFECKRNLKWFLPPFCKNMLPAAAGSTFLKTNFEQSAFKNPLFGALKASNEDSLGHLFGTYGSQTFFSPLFRFSRPSKFWKIVGKTYYFRTWSRPKSDPTLQMQILMQTQVQIRMQMQFEVIFASVWVRLKRFLPPFGSVFASFFDGLGSASAHASAHAIANESATVIWLGRPADCQ